MVRLHSPTNSPSPPPQIAACHSRRRIRVSDIYNNQQHIPQAQEKTKCQIRALGRGRPWPLEAGLPPPVSRSETQSLGTCKELTSQMPDSVTVTDQKSLASGAVGYASCVDIDSSVGRVMRYVVLQSQYRRDTHEGSSTRTKGPFVDVESSPKCYYRRHRRVRPHHHAHTILET